jgi:MFS family permease
VPADSAGGRSHCRLPATAFQPSSPAIAFWLLWGYPFLVGAQGRSPADAGLLLTILTVSFMCFSPVVGQLVGRYPLRRSWMVLAVVGSSAVAWTAVLGWPGPSPFWLLVTLVVVLGANQPGSMIGFDYARSFNHTSRLGGAAGIVNMGGYAASLTTILLIGLVLNLLSAPGSTTYPPQAFDWAFAVQYPVWAVGAVQVLRYRRKARRAYHNAPELPPRELAPDLAA